MSMNPMFEVAEYQQAGRAYVYAEECGSKKWGYYTGYFVCVGGVPRPHTGPVATREEAEAIRDRINATH